MNQKSLLNSPSQLLFIFNAKVDYMWFSKKLKMSEILLVTAFDVICNSSFDSKCLHHSMHLPYCTDLQERDIKMGVTQTGTTIVKRQKSSQIVS